MLARDPLPPDETTTRASAPPRVILVSGGDLSDEGEGDASLRDANLRDDDANDLDDVAHSLGALVELTRPADAIRAALDAPRRPDCLVIGRSLDKAHTLALLAALTAPDGSIACPVVVLTKRADDALDLLRAGAQECIDDPRDLARAVEHARARHRTTTRPETRDDARACDTVLALIRNNPFGNFIVDADFRLREVSHGAERVFANVRPLIGRDFADVLRIIWSEPFASEAIARFRRTLATGERYVAPTTMERRADLGIIEAYDWRVDRIELPNHRYGAVCYFYDLSERQRWEAALQESESFYRQTLDTIPGMVFTCTPDGAVDYVNDQWVAFTGVAASEQLGARWLEVLHPDDRARISGSWRAALEGRGHYDVEYRLRAADGHFEWFKARCRAIRDATGEVVRWFGAAANVDDLKRFERELAERELRYRLVAHTTKDVIWDWDLVSDRIIWNEGIERRFGYVAKQLPPESSWWMNAIHPEDRARVVDLIHAHIENGPDDWQDEYRFRRADNTYAVIADRGRVVRDGTGRALRMVGSMLDLTEQRRTEAELHAAEERFAFVRKTSGVGFWYCDLPFRTLEWDEHVRSHFFLPEDSAVTIDTLYERLHADDRAPVQAAIERSILQRIPFDATCRTIDPATGAERWIRAIGRTSYSDDGTPLQFDGVTIDVSEHQRAEEALREQDRRKDEFIATLAHELRNPLAPIRTGLQVLKMSECGGARTSRSLEMMDRQLSHMVRLIDDLLDVSRISRGQVELKRERVQVKTIVEHAVETSRPLVEVGQHALTIEVPAAPLWVDGDLTRLAQVVSNLLNNAAKYTPNGGSIALTVHSDGGEAVVRVKDNGTGISPDMLPKIFDLFGQADRTRNRAQGGLGIGLSLVKKLVTMHGASISVESPGVGGGSTFSVRLPLVADDALHSLSPSSEAGAVAAAGRRILVVDDNIDGAESLAMLLQLFGHDTCAVHDGPEALTAAKSYHPDAIFLDIGLPGMSGYEVAKQLRADSCLAQTRLIALTGWGTDEDKRKSAEAGFDVHLTKPVDAAVVEKLLDGLWRTH